MSSVPFSSPDTGYLQVGDHLVDLGGHRILDNGVERRLTPKAVAVLALLAQERGRTVSTDELLDRIWAGTCPTVDVVRQIIRELRRALDAPTGTSRYIETIARAGYRLIAECEFLDRLPENKASASIAAPLRSGPLHDPGRLGKWRMNLASAGGLVALIVVALLAWSEVPPAASTAIGRTTMPERDVVMITSEPSRDVQPRLSPDGTRVVYATSVNGGSAQIRVSGIDGSGQVVLSRHQEGSAGSPAWSPDGLHIAYYHWSQTHCRIVVVAALGGSERSHDACLPDLPGSLEWTADSRGLLVSQRMDPQLQVFKLQHLDLQSGELTPFGDSDPYNTIDELPRLSPDGQWLAVRRGSSPLSDLWLLPMHGGPARRLTSFQAHMRGHGWSSDGSGLVFSSNHSGQTGLYWLELATEATSSLEIGEAIFPSLSEQGLLLFQRIRYHVVLSNLHESEPEMIEQPLQAMHPSTGSEFNPVFSPDGRYLAFASTRSGRWQLWVHDRKQDEVFQLTRLRVGHIKVPAWNPDSRRMLIPVRDGEKSVLFEADVAQRTLQPVWQDPRFLESAAYGEKDERWLAIGDAGAVTLHTLRLNGAAVALESRHLSASGLQTRSGDPGVYYREPRSGALYRFDPESLLRQRLQIPISPWQWRLQDDGLHALSLPEQGEYGQWQYDLERHHAHRLPVGLTTPALFPLVSYAADRDPVSGHWVVTLVAMTQDDIAAVVLPEFTQVSDGKHLMALSWQ